MTNKDIEFEDEDEEEEKKTTLLQETIILLNKYKLRSQDLILFYAELGYSIGSSMEEFTPETLPTIDQLQEDYYKNPTAGKALMLQSLLLESWKKETIK